ncbi:DEAD/DEAH box helicase [Peptococcus simiae]|uniref:DEAD/DEAH box helicase n=1 Tax=Peptococcus simiae TaxID=1643805 RepID=A0ABW9H1K9_9FIRM
MTKEMERNEDCIEEKDLVYLISTPEKRGAVLSVSSVGARKRYQVFIDGAVKTFYAGQIARVDDSNEYEWTPINKFRSILTAYQLNNPSMHDLYSLNSARIDFVPYQFRPALKLIHADEPRILIADSVGVGKTIEAGLIIKELAARKDLKNILIICPKPLVTERKWELEMKRFDEQFYPVDGATLRQIILDTECDGRWPSRYSRIIIPYSILDSTIYEGKGRKTSTGFGLKNLNPAPHFDLVIVDEAHHIRNGSMQKEKAFAYKSTRYFCDHADAVVMLTATPLQTSDRDLFTLLNVLRPDVVIDESTFSTMMEPNEYISEAVHVIRSAGEHWQQKTINTLKSIEDTSWGDKVISRHPNYQAVISTLKKPNLSRSERVKLISRTESLHSFDTMINRTRRRDIQDFCIRRSHTLETRFTDYQRNLHDAVQKFEAEVLSILHSESSILFMMTTLRRQTASCIFGLAPFLEDIIHRRLGQINEYVDLFMDDLSDGACNKFVKMAEEIMDLANNLPTEDPKFDSVLEIIKQKQEQGNNKIILFSTFRHTLNYLKRKLNQEGLRVAQIDGSVEDFQRLEYRRRFELHKADREAIDILLFTEVGSEGLDYQFCDMLINYDLPWNPMRIEQRIGRIDRRGQQSDVVNIYNVITADTVDADIYHRCLNRIGIFERSLGECEAIIGEMASKIERIIVNDELTQDEREIKLEQMADNEVRRIQELNNLEEAQKELFGFDLSNMNMTTELEQATNDWLSAPLVQKLIENYLDERLEEGNHVMGDDKIKRLRLNAGSRQKLLEDFRNLEVVSDSSSVGWERFLKGGKATHEITFEAEAAEANENIFFITSMHPLSRQAAKYYATDQVARICMTCDYDQIAPGEYPFSLYAWKYTGLKNNFELICISEEDDLSQNLLEIILGDCRDLKTVSDADYKEAWDHLEESHIKKWEQSKNRYLQEVSATSTFRLESLKDSFERKRTRLEKQIDEAQDEGIKRMRTSELATIERRYSSKVEEIRDLAGRADVHTSLLANGIIKVK